MSVPGKEEGRVDDDLSLPSGVLYTGLHHPLKLGGDMRSVSSVIS